MSEQINKDRKPTPADMKILAWLQTGNSINNLQAIQQFKNAMLRDAAWRLKKAGYPIQSVWIKYKTSDNVQKKYKSYFITEPTVMEAGVKVEKAVNAPTSDRNTARIEDNSLRQARLFPM